MTNRGRAWVVGCVLSAIVGGGVSQGQTRVPPPAPLPPPERITVKPMDPAARAAMIAARERAAAEARAAETAAQGAELSRLLGERRAAVMLPKWARQVYLDAKGQAWVEAESQASNGATEEALRSSVKEAGLGHQRVIHGGQPVLRDGKGRVWAVRRERGALLVGSDGKQLFERRASEEYAPTRPEGFFREEAWEDEAGNVYFIGEDARRGFGVHRLSAADGTWSYVNVAPPDPIRTGFFAGGRLAVARQAGGRMTVYALDGGGPAERVRALHFDGKAWRMVAPAVCPAHDRVEAVVPLADGGIATICEHQRLWTYWPDAGGGAAGGEGEAARVKALVRQLEDADTAVRDKATAGLVAMGPGIRERVKAALEDADSPEVKVRLASVLDSFAALAGGRGGANTRMLQGGRYTFGSVYVASRRADGRVTFFVEEVRDRMTTKEYAGALASLSADGTWGLRPVDLEQWVNEGMRQYPRNEYEDSRGRIYIDQRHRVRADGRLERVTEFGVDIDRILGEDAAGRLFARGNGRVYVLDESAPAGGAGAGALAVARYSGQFFGLRADGTLFGSGVNGSPERLMRFTKGAWQAVGGLPGGNPWNVVALRGGGALVELADPWSGHLFDGTQWYHADSLAEVVRAHPEVLAKSLGARFTAIGDARLGVGARGQVWFAQSRWEEDANGRQAFVNRLMFHDGRQWHDVWKEAGLPLADWQNVFVGMVDQGAAVLVQDRQFVVQRIAYDERGAVRVTPVELAKGERLLAETWPAPDGSMWVSGRIGGYMRYADGRFEKVALKGPPLLVDSRSRLWLAPMAEPGSVQVVDGGAAPVSVRVEGFDSSGALVETPDGRFVLLHAGGVSELKVEAAGVREVGRWAWESPRNSFKSAIADGDGGVWFRGGEERMVRFVLPAAPGK